MSKKDFNEVKSERVVVTIELDIVTFPSGSKWVTDISHVDKINTALRDARYEMLSHDPDQLPDLYEEKLQQIEATARNAIRDNDLYSASFKRIKDNDLFSALRDMLGVNCFVNAAMKLNPWTGGC